ncbi:reverse transcriptase domain-containing protein [Tanacetum coccineum]|uniref:Reverse transcriptase domain-containing protein n=1 Tax=Tanacetum coccineum TaxID=301880 RepID=A0ABQ4ZW47_9ASTR
MKTNKRIHQEDTAYPMPANHQTTGIKLNTPYPEDQYAVFKIWNEYNYFGSIMRGLYSKNPHKLYPILGFNPDSSISFLFLPDRMPDIGRVLNKFIDEGKREHEEGLEKSIDQSDLECCESTCNDEKNEADLKTLIRRIDSVNMSYPVTQRGTNESDHLYLASANEIDEEKPKLKNLPQHLEYAYLHGDKSFPIIISSKLSEEEKISLLRVLDKRKGAIAWKIFFQIPIALEDQEKTTFTCPYGTFAYKRMPFGLCNAPATFQRCMTAIFHDMVEDFMEVFMDDFSVFHNSFDCFLANLDRMLARCEKQHCAKLGKMPFYGKRRDSLDNKFPEQDSSFVDRAKINGIG